MQCENPPSRELEGRIGRLSCPGLETLVDSNLLRREKLKVFILRAVGEHRRFQLLRAGNAFVFSWREGQVSAILGTGLHGFELPEQSLCSGSSKPW